VNSDVSVVMITRDRRADVIATLQRLLALDERVPLLVVDNGSTDGTADAVQRLYPGVTVLALPDNRGGAARTIGVSAARTPYVAFSDDDSWWAPTALTTAVARMNARPTLGLLAARVLVGADERLDPVSAAMADSPLGDVPGVGPRVIGFVACGAVVRRSAYLEAGGFHPAYGVGGEEALLALDLMDRGWELAYCGDVVAHHHPSSVRDHTARRQRVDRNDLWTLWLRRPVPAAVRGTGSYLRRGLSEPSTRRALVDAAVGLPWVVRRRRVVGDSTERAVAIVEGGSHATGRPCVEG
jgi:GT2 family glycosyltransferase